jgi:hypothetical protein
MDTSKFRRERYLACIFRLCPCLALVGIIILGAADHAAAASAPEIKVFSAAPTVLKDGDFAVYTFTVQDATNIQLTENGNIIKDIKGPASSTYEGKAHGMKTYALRTRGSNSVTAILIASNGSGKADKTLTLTYATQLPPQPATQTISDNKTSARTPKWGPQSSNPAVSSQSTSSTYNAPQFAKCSSDCNACLTPDEAAAKGYTQKCSEQPCYYSPDNQQKWYCYSKPKTVWCCKDGQVSEVTQAQCDQVGGTAYPTQADAVKACQQALGWFCSGGQVYQGSAAQASQAGVQWYANQQDAINACQGGGYCCINGNVSGPMSPSQCAQMGGTYYATPGQAKELCQPPNCYCCINGNVSGPMTPSQCAQRGGVCYTTPAQAKELCQPPKTYWCCSNGQVYQTTTPGVGCYATQAQAQAACQRKTTTLPLK